MREQNEKMAHCPSSVLIRQVPTILAQADVTRLVQNVISDLTELGYS